MAKYVSLHDRLRTDIREGLKQDLGDKNVHAIPTIKMVTVNVGINRSKMEGKEMQEYIVDCLSKITGQKPTLRKTRKAISNFKTRVGLVVGASVTLRGKKMEDFLDRLISYVLPRIRDFRGLPTKLDGRGNYAIGLKEHSVFPEVPAEDGLKTFGLQIQITTTAGTDERGRALLKRLGMPLRPARSVDS